MTVLFRVDTMTLGPVYNQIVVAARVDDVRVDGSVVLLLAPPPDDGTMQAQDESVRCDRANSNNTDLMSAEHIRPCRMVSTQ